MLAFIKQNYYFYLFDSHATDCSGMPDPHGTAVLMKFTNILELQQYVIALSKSVHSNIFEIVPIKITKCIAPQQSDVDKQIRLQKSNESRKTKLSKETDSEREIRQSKDRLYKKQKGAKNTSQPKEKINQDDCLKTVQKQKVQDAPAWF